MRAAFRAAGFTVLTDSKYLISPDYLLPGDILLLDRKHTLYRRINKDMVELEELQEKYDIEELRRILEEYVNETDSRLGREILSHFEEEVPCFKKVIARDYQRMIRTIGKYEERGISKENAQLEAFREISGQTA